jgi:hypothetical protein
MQVVATRELMRLWGDAIGVIVAAAYFPYHARRLTVPLN